MGVGDEVEESLLKRPRIPSESVAPGELMMAGSLGWPLSEAEPRKECRDEVSSFAQSKELDEPYSHSEWRLEQLEHVGRASSHYGRC